MRAKSHILTENFCSSFNILLVDSRVECLKDANSYTLVFLHISILEVGVHHILVTNELFEGICDFTCRIVQIAIFNNEGEAIPPFDLLLEHSSCRCHAGHEYFTVK